MNENFIREPTIEQCWGCQKERVGPYPGPAICVAYLYPSAQWRHGRRCALATHLLKEQKKEGFIDPIKKSKQLAKLK